MYLVCVYIHTNIYMYINIYIYIYILKAQITKISALFSINGNAEDSHWVIEFPLFIWEQEPHSFPWYQTLYADKILQPS